MDEKLLQYYAKEWSRYTTAANVIDRLFAYLNRNWVKQEREEGRRGVYPVYTVRLVDFSTIVRKVRNIRSYLIAGARAMEANILKSHPEQ